MLLLSIKIAAAGLYFNNESRYLFFDTFRDPGKRFLDGIYRMKRDKESEMQRKIMFNLML